jgi:hypothetical protein
VRGRPRFVERGRRLEVPTPCRHGCNENSHVRCRSGYGYRTVTTVSGATAPCVTS